MEYPTADDAQGDGLYMEDQNDVLNDLDPHLQELILAFNNKEELSSEIVWSKDGRQQVDVIAKLRDPRHTVPGLEVVRKIDDIVTGSVALGEIERVRRHDNVRSLKAATKLHRDLSTSVTEVRCDAESLRTAFPELDAGLDGSGVIVGVVDYGCDFTHRNFRREDDTTRLLYLWDQRPGKKTPPPPKGFGYGRELDAAKLNAALREPDPFAAVSYRLTSEAHGTHVMDIAAGNGRETGTGPGVAPNADLIFVHVAANDVGDDESLGNSRRLLEAVEYVFVKAEELGRPAVVNLSLGTHGGPHDGTTLVEQGFERLLNKPGRAIVVSAGNSRNRQCHVQGTVSPGQEQTLSWIVDPLDLTPNELEVWYPGSGGLTLSLMTPDGKRLKPVPPGKTSVIRKQGSSERMGRIIHRRGDPNNGAYQIDVLLTTSLSSGTWKVVLANPGGQPVDFHAWIERDDEGQSRFTSSEATPTHTLGSICCSERTITVGSYNSRDSRRGISTFSSEGPTRDGREKPEVSAPGQDIVAASALSDFTTMSGTSMAAPHVTGLVALLFHAARRPLDVNEIRQALVSSARKNPPLQGGDMRYGRGRIDGVAAVRSVMPAPVAVGPRANVAAAYQPTLVVVPTAEEMQPINGEVSLSQLLQNVMAGKMDIRFSIVERVQQ